jgi:formylglycine-generating enzyme required for sulfatase activity
VFNTAGVPALDGRAADARPDRARADEAASDSLAPRPEVPRADADTDAPPKPDLPRPEASKPDAKPKPDLPRPEAGKPDAKPKPDLPRPEAGKPDLQPKPDLPAVPGNWLALAAGSFAMGSPAGEKCHQGNETLHSVTLTHGFAITAHETTQAAFLAVLGYTPSLFLNCGGSCPVENVSWHEAAAYCNALSAKKALTPCYSCTGSGASVTCVTAVPFDGAGAIYNCPGFRLPTDAEWEYAYRAGTGSALYNGGITSCTGSDSGANQIGWNKFNAGGSPKPFGQKAANAWGLVDLAGNVWEWAHDRYLDNLGASAATDPSGPPGGGDSVCRGGSWLNEPQHMRAAWRGKCATWARANWLGFRCAITK